MAHMVIVDGIAAGVWRAADAWDDQTRWGTPQRPDRVLWGEPDAPYVVEWT